ncbi:MAG: hypothetical protein AB1298_05925 [Bacteroidota bacterium]
MNCSFCRLLINVSVLLLMISSNLTAQFTIRGNLESGFYRSIENFLSNENDLLFALEGKLGYKFKEENTEASFELKTRQEWFGLNKELFSFKFRGSGDLVRREENFDWGIGITRHLNRISGRSIDIDYDIFSIQGNATFYWFENAPVSVVLGYAYQNIASSIQQNHDIVFLEGKVHDVFSSFFKTGYGLYIEKFLIEGETIVNYNKRKESNGGVRIGPKLEIHYLKDFVVNGQYRFLFHFSDKAKPISYEHWVRLVAGKFLFSGFSTFLLIDYFWRNIKAGNDSKTINILYSPFNLENNISLKIGYELTGSLELYLKSGYFRNNLVYNNYTFAGWNFLFGIEFLH